MASIYVYNIGSTRFSAQLTGLQTTGSDGKPLTYTRKCQWTVREDSSNNTVSIVTEYITQGETEGVAHTFSGLSANTEYAVSCTVYRNDTGAYLASFSENVTTSGGGGGSGETESLWSVDNYVSLNHIDTETTIDISLKRYTVYRCAVSFANAGQAQFYTTGNIDTFGEFSDDDCEFDGEKGQVEGYLRRNKDGYDGKNFLITYPITAQDVGEVFYVWVSSQSGTAIGTTTLHIVPPEGASDKWTWSNSANNAFANNGDTRDVPYTEWNKFVNFVAEKTGYPVSSALMSASDTTLYATQFNAVRYAIGSVNTFQNGTNSIKNHYTETGQWDMSSGEVVKGQYFIDLAKYLNGIQT